MLAAQRKILLLGPSGAGKSSLCNAINNQKVDLDSLKKPAGVSARAQGVTETIENYWCDNSLVITDTIGFDDARFEPEEIVQELRKMLYESRIRYEKLILCMKIGRVSEPARVYLRLLKAIFDNPFSNMILYISGCEDGTTKEEFLEMNRNIEDPEMKVLLNSLEEESLKKKENNINFENIVLGTLQCHKNPEIDRKKFIDDREATLSKIMEGINADIGTVEAKGPDQLWKAITQWMTWLFKDFYASATKGQSRLKSLFKIASGAIQVNYNYGECSICHDDEEGQKWIITGCFHRFHDNCFRRIGENSICPLCRKVVTEKQNLP